MKIIKLNILVTLITMTVISVTDLGLVKLIGFAVLTVNFLIFARMFEGVGNERR